MCIRDSYKGGGKYGFAKEGKDGSDDELNSKDLFSNLSEDDEEEQIVIVNTRQPEKRIRGE